MILRATAILGAVLLGGLPALGGAISAEFTKPTTRYGHGILGDAIEFGALSILTDANTRVTITLPQDHVFEDIAPRLADIDGDGDNEIIVIETDVSLGAALAIYDETGKLAETPHIGQSNRWLAPVGIADFNRDGDMDVAYIDRPHLAKTLMIWTYRNGALVQIAEAGGLTNHRIGEDWISGGVRVCYGLPEMITVNSNWTKVVATRLDGTALTKRTLGAFRGQKSLKQALAGC